LYAQQLGTPKSVCSSPRSEGLCPQNVTKVEEYNVYIVKQKQTKNVVDFQNFRKSNFVRSKFLKIQSSINLPWGQTRPHKKNYI